jgi:hypothetical protein
MTDRSAPHPYYEFARPIGGATALARACDVSEHTAESWARFGIPERHWRRVLELAAEAGRPLDANRLHDLNCRIRDRSRRLGLWAAHRGRENGRQRRSAAATTTP